MINILFHQGNANQNYTEILCHHPPHQNGFHKKKKKKNTHAGENMVGGKKLLFTAVVNVN
jgi:hypothetical protein